MGSISTDVSFAFTNEAINAALKEAHRHGCKVVISNQPKPPNLVNIAETTMLQILNAAWREQAKGDSNIDDLRSMARGLEREIARLQEEAHKNRREWKESLAAKLEASEIDKVQRNIRVLLAGGSKRYSTRKKWCNAYEYLKEWVGGWT